MKTNSTRVPLNKAQANLDEICKAVTSSRDIIIINDLQVRMSLFLPQTNCQA